MIWDLQIIFYWALVLVVSVPLYTLAPRYTKCSTVSGFVVLPGHLGNVRCH
jgi:hypothetical protein